MEQIKNQLRARKNFLVKLKKEKEKVLRSAPEGLLRVCCHGNRTQYYLRNNPKDFNGVYIPRKDEDLVRKLAQKDYAARILKNAEKEIKVIDEFLSHYPSLCVEQIYEKLHRERQKLIHPIIESIEEYVYNWENGIFQGDNLILTYETRKSPINQKQIRRIIHHYLL